MHDTTDIMFDIETLGNEGKFLVLSIGIVPFNLDTKEVFDGYKFNISLNDSIDHGFKINEGTLLWWLDKDKDIFKSLFKDSETIDVVTDNVTALINKLNPQRFWATAVLDYQGISNLFDCVGKPNPIRYDKRFCARTVRMLHRRSSSDEIAPYINTTNHDPEDDCRAQIDELFRDL